MDLGSLTSPMKSLSLYPITWGETVSKYNHILTPIKHSKRDFTTANYFKPYCCALAHIITSPACPIAVLISLASV